MTIKNRLNQFGNLYRAKFNIEHEILIETNAAAGYEKCPKCKQQEKNEFRRGVAAGLNFALEQIDGVIISHLRGLK